MSYTVNIGITSKKINSTSTTYTILVSGASCLLKKPTDIKAPTFTFQGAFPESANYFYVAEWTKFFWLTSAVFTEGHWEFSGKCDVLATYKAAIGGSQQYVARSYHDVDLNVPDALCQANGFLSTQAAFYNVGFSSVGSYIVGVAGINGTMYYACTKQNFDALYTDVFSNGFLENLLSQAANAIQQVNSGLTQTFGEVLYNSFVDPGQYIQSAIWIPFTVSGSAAQITLGVTPTQAFGIPVTADRIVAQSNTTLDLASATWSHPQRAALGKWVNSNLGRQMSLSIPAIGDIHLDMASAPTYCTIQYSVDIFGTVTCRINTDGQTIVRNGNVGVQVGIANIRSDIMGSLASIGTAAAGLVSGNPVMTAHGILSGFSNMMGQVDSIATGGSMSIVNSAPVIQANAQYTTFKDCDRETQGKPLCAIRTISTIPGYIECINASVSCAALESEKQEINSFLNGGFYYE